jgi:hypothetical protein
MAFLWRSMPPSPYVDIQMIDNKTLSIVARAQNRPNKGVIAKIVQAKGLVAVSPF